MKQRSSLRSLALVGLVGALSTLVGCGGGGKGGPDLSATPASAGTTPVISTPVAAYMVQVVNVTNNQPLSPPALVVHGDGYRAFRPGQPASLGLEVLAEAGSPADLLNEARADAAVRTTARGDAVVPPGGLTLIQFAVQAGQPVQVSLATMLVNTNDAFAGVSGVDVSDLAAGQSRRLRARVYDAGTEDNSEAAGEVPGPAGGGQGFAPTRSARDFVAVHPGVVTRADGLASSALDESHRWLGPAAQVVITRLS